jgi:exoribonuclease R
MTTPGSTQREGPIDQRQHRARQAYGATYGRFERFLATTLQVPHTLLMKRPRGEYVLELPGDESAGHFGLAVRDYTHSTAPSARLMKVCRP